MKKKKTNFGLSKNDMSLDLSRINFDYIKGIIHTDGHLKEVTPNQKKVVISQTQPTFIKALKDFIDSRLELDGKLYMNGEQLAYSSVRFYDYITNRPILDYGKYYAGIIDGDGSISSHSKHHWRFQLGASKERKLKIFRELFDFYGFEYSSSINKNTNCITYTLSKTKELSKLLKEVQKYILLKKDIVDLVLKQINEYFESLKGVCIYCGAEFKRNTHIYPETKSRSERKHCYKKECHRKYKTNGMRKLRALKQGLSES